MANPFVNVISSFNDNAVNRNFGGTMSNVVADPYITGYHYIKWLKLPPQLKHVMNRSKATVAQQDLTKPGSPQSIMEGACLSVTPPGGTLNTTEITGIGGTKWKVPTNIDYTNTITIKFLEFHYLPILTVIHSWVRLIRDYKSGTTFLDTTYHAYSKDAYAGTLLYWTTKPDGWHVEYCACYSGVFPTKDPQDLYSGDLASVDKLEVDIEFSLDRIYHEEWVRQKCQDIAMYQHLNDIGISKKYGADADIEGYDK